MEHDFEEETVDGYADETEAQMDVDEEAADDMHEATDDLKPLSRRVESALQSAKTRDFDSLKQVPVNQAVAAKIVEAMKRKDFDANSVFPRLSAEMTAALHKAVMADLLHMRGLARLGLHKLWSSEDDLVVDLAVSVGTGSIDRETWEFFMEFACMPSGSSDPYFWHPLSVFQARAVMTVLLALMVHRLRHLGVHGVCDVFDTHCSCPLLNNDDNDLKPDGCYSHTNPGDIRACHLSRYGGGNKCCRPDGTRWKNEMSIFDWEVRTLALMFECSSAFLDVSGHAGTIDVGSDGINIRCMRTIKSHVTGELQVSVSGRMELLPTGINKDGAPPDGFVLLARRLCADPVKTGVRSIPPALAGHLIAVATAVQVIPDGSADAVAAEMAAKKMAALQQSASSVVVDLAAVAAAAVATMAASAPAPATAPAPAPGALVVAGAPAQQATDHLVEAAAAGARAATREAAEQVKPRPRAIVSLRPTKVFDLAGKFKAKFLQPEELEAERAVLHLPWHLAENMVDGQRLVSRLLYEHPVGILVTPLVQCTLWEAREKFYRWVASLREIVQAVTAALSVMHLHRRLHCDLTPHSILVDGSGNVRVVLSDFGLSVPMDPGRDGHVLTTERGYVGFRATTVSVGHEYTTGDDLEALYWTLVALASSKDGGIPRPERLGMLRERLRRKNLGHFCFEDTEEALEEVHEAVRRRHLHALQRPLTYDAFTSAFSRTHAERERLQAARDTFLACLPEYFASNPLAVAAGAAQGWLPPAVHQAWSTLAPDEQQFFLKNS